MLALLALLALLGLLAFAFACLILHLHRNASSAPSCACLRPSPLALLAAAWRSLLTLVSLNTVTCRTAPSPTCGPRAAHSPSWRPTLVWEVRPLGWTVCQRFCCRLAAEASFCCGAPSTQCQPFSCAPCSRLLPMPQAMATPCSSSKHNTCAMQKVLKQAPFKCRRLRLPRAHRLQPGQGQVRHQQVSEVARGVVPAALNLCRCCGIAASG